MSILSRRASLGQPRPGFSLAALADFVTVGDAPAIHRATAAFDDVIADADDLAVLADLLGIPAYEVGPDDGPAPAAFTPEPIPSRADFEAVADFWHVGIDDILPCYPTKEDDLFYVGYELERDGEPALLKDRDVPDLALQLAFANGRRAAREERQGRLAREAKEAEAKALRDAYGAGQAAGWAGADPIVPHGYTPAQARSFGKGFDAGLDVRAVEMAECHAEAEPITDRDVYGPRLTAAIAEDSEDREEWSFA